jgi:protein required for attachment to host cells
MRVRIVVADECAARFYDATGFRSGLQPAGTMADCRQRSAARGPMGDRRERGVPQGFQWCDGALAVADEDGSRQRQAAAQFAHRVADRLEDALRHDRFDRLVVFAGRPFLGVLRSELSSRVRDVVVAEVPKDLVQQPDGAVSVYVPRTAFEGAVPKQRIDATA